MEAPAGTASPFASIAMPFVSSSPSTTEYSKVRTALPEPRTRAALREAEPISSASVGAPLTFTASAKVISMPIVSPIL